MESPLISVLVLTYNHKEFIEKTLDSVFMQNTNFSFEIVVGDDFSNDGTRDILNKYKEKKPDKIVLNLLPEKGKGMIGHENFVTTYEKCRGKYIAFLDGDDYWIDKNKLQRQVDLLEGNNQFTLVHHDCESAETYGIKKKKEFNKSHQVTGFYDLCQITAPFMSSVVLRKESLEKLNLREWLGDLELGDFALWTLASLYGDAYYIDDEMGFYRVNTGGVTTHLGAEVQARNRARLAEKLLRSGFYINKKFINKFLCRNYFISAVIHFRKREFGNYFKYSLRSLKNFIKGMSFKSGNYNWIERLKWKSLIRLSASQFIGVFKTG